MPGTGPGTTAVVVVYALSFSRAGGSTHKFTWLEKIERVYDFMRCQYLPDDNKTAIFCKEYNILFRKNTPILGDFEKPTVSR
jgi:hypothetical protein